MVAVFTMKCNDSDIMVYYLYIFVYLHFNLDLVSCTYNKWTQPVQRNVIVVNNRIVADVPLISQANHSITGTYYILYF